MKSCKRAIKRIAASLLVAVMIITAAPISGFANLNFDWLSFNTKASALESSGSCGTNVTYTFDETTGLLIISGTGKMEDYNYTIYNKKNSPFYNDSKILKVIIEDGVTSIGAWAFKGCSSLTKITIPDSVTSIGGSAFSGCSSLTSITIPDSITSIGGTAFVGCTSLEKIIVDTNNPVYDSRNNCNAIIETKSNTLIQGFKNTVIPDSVTSIDACAFSGCSNLTSITIPDSVMSIGSYAFYGCSSLTSITIPDSVTSIGNFTFEDCSSLTSVTIPDSVTSIGFGVFEDCSNLKEVNFGKYSQLNTIGSYAFSDCDDVIFYCYKDTYAYEYAVSQNINYVLLDEAEHIHSYEQIIVPATCTEQGYTTYTCSFCDNSYVDNYVPAKGHTEGKAVVTKQATTKEDGELTVYCKDCGEVIRTVVIQKLNGKVHSVSINDISLNYKGSTTLKPTITADEGVKYTVKYSSSNTKVATVDDNGKVTATKRGSGSATITCTVTDEYGNTVSDTCKVNVSLSFGQKLIVYVLFGWIWY